MLIAIEGVDKAGKSTYIRENYPDHVVFRFPNRDTPVGQLIDRYLKKEIEFNPETIQHLFVANFHEMQDEISENLNQGYDVILDRYILSNVVYGIRKGLDETWCKSLVENLIKPDLTIYLDISDVELEERLDGEEIYERIDFLREVKEIFMEQLNEIDHRVTVSFSGTS